MPDDEIYGQSRPSTIAFNINSYVRVKPSLQFREIWREDAERMRAAQPKLAHLWPLEPPLDDAGFYRAQLWWVIHLVGPISVAGSAPFEDGCLHLEIEQ